MNKTKLNDITTVVSKQGQNVVAGTSYDLIQIWKSWYRGNVNDFHRYKIKGAGGIEIECEKLTFGIPKKIAEDWASLLWNEKVEFNTGNDEINKRLYEVLEENSYQIELGNLIEKTFGYTGLGAIIEYLVDGDTTIDYISGEYVIITAGKGTRVKGLITINEIELNKQYITHLTFHSIIDDRYIVEHQAFISDKDTELGKKSIGALAHIFKEETLKDMQEITYDEKGNIIEVKYVVIHETNIPCFQIIKPNITNNYDTDSKMGIPVIANSIDTYKALDNAYEGLNTESVNNKTLIVFNDKATKKKTKNDPETGITSYVKYIDNHDTRFISSPMGDKEDWVKHYAGTFTAEEYIKAINSNLGWASFKAGLGTGYYSFDGTNTYVNEKQIISTNNDTWKNKVKHEIGLRESFIGMIKAIIFLEQSQKRIPNIDIDTLAITVKFDDSIIIDDEELKKNSLQLVTDGYKPKWKHLVEWENMTEDEAKQSVAEATEEDELAFQLATPEPEEVVEEDE
jgi:A118 family predicted phage portal protein